MGEGNAWSLGSNCKQNSDQEVVMRKQRALRAERDRRVRGPYTLPMGEDGGLGNPASLGW